MDEPVEGEFGGSVELVVRSLEDDGARTIYGSESERDILGGVLEWSIGP